MATTTDFIVIGGACVVTLALTPPASGYGWRNTFADMRTWCSKKRRRFRNWCRDYFDDPVSQIGQVIVVLGVIGLVIEFVWLSRQP